MPTKIEKDAVTGTETTGHVWDGIKELNTPLPSWWLYVLYATIVFSLVYSVLYPVLPGVGGLLGYNSREELDVKMAKVRERQADELARIAEMTADDIAADPELLQFSLAGGRVAFADNCAPCHGPGGAGQRGYPSLADDRWLWGGTRDDIAETLAVGIRSQHEDTRFSEMPAFAGFFEPEQLDQLVDHVLFLSGAGEETAAGAELFADNCAACHGDAGDGDQSQGAPALDDQIWLYGGDKKDVIAQILKPQHGVMPSWGGRLDPATLKMLTVYVHALGGGQ